MKEALLLIDIQNDYFPGGKMALVGMEQAAQNAHALLRAFRAENRPVIHVQHLSIRPGSTFFVPGTPGVEVHASVAPQSGEPVITKYFPNSFRDTNLLDTLKNLEVEQLVVCGAMTQMCIDATARAAFDLAFRCLIAEDACATRDLEYNGIMVKAAQVQAAFMAALASVYATVVSTSAYLEGRQKR